MNNLTDLLSELRVLLNDVTGHTFSDTLLIGLVRQAVARLQLVCPHQLSVAGLDDAEQTSMDQRMFAILHRLACLDALRQRWQARLETYHPDAPQSLLPLAWLTGEQQALEELLESFRRLYFHTSPNVPYSEWPESGVDGETPCLP
ncbi:MAG: hypothetical protein CVU39_21050 [Chloroflexi bacterium HGW-Chloroflexi-10]|nr:MAG: hypothetical protein CVU39_21050 [Chloroflexi bacterium HGW-Chloroflexi-10]